jgi:hypothetical protein
LRILIVASSLIGSPSSSICIVTRANDSSACPGRRSRSSLGIGSTFVTLPTSTPAMRTGERCFSSFADRTTKFSSYGSAKGFAFVNAK